LLYNPGKRTEHIRITAQTVVQFLTLMARSKMTNKIVDLLILELKLYIEGHTSASISIENYRRGIAALYK
jgi:hypothetical protein